VTPLGDRRPHLQRSGSRPRRSEYEVEYDPNRNARIALLHYYDGEKR